MNQSWSDITPQEVEEWIQSQREDLQFIDVRELAEYQEGHIKEVKLIPLSQLEVRHDEIDRNKETVVICRRGNRSRQACEFLSSYGYQKLHNMAGGMMNWQGANNKRLSERILIPKSKDRLLSRYNIEEGEGMDIKVDRVVDAKGLACPMPIVRTKKAINELDAGQVLELQATDKGSVADIQAWAKSTGHQFLGTQQEDKVYRHYVRKSEPNEIKEEITFPHSVRNDELDSLLDGDKEIHILDVREPAEYAFGRLKGSKNIPLGDLEKRVDELNPEDEIYIVCRTGNRSNLAANLLTEKGFKNLKNVIPGMSEWTGSVERDSFNPLN